MARNKGTFSYAANYEVKVQAALDPRISVETKAELIKKETWPYDGDTIYLYKGLVVSVQDENALYMLVDMSKILSTDYSGWLRVDAGNAEQIDVIDNLESDRADAALSAKQGKAIKGMLDGKADLDEAGKILATQLPDYILGQVMFGGTVAYSNVDSQWKITPTQSFKDRFNTADEFIDSMPAADYEGVYFIAQSSGSVFSLDINVGDWIISNGSEWVKVDNTDAVASVAGLTGTITANALAGKLAEEGTLAKSEDVKGLLKDVETDDYFKVTVNQTTGKLEKIEADQELKTALGLGSTAHQLSEQNKTALDTLSLTVGNINLVLNGNNNPDDDITDTVGLVDRLEAVEDELGSRAEGEEDKGTVLTRLTALENLVTGGEGEEGEGDQTLLQKVSANTLAISALEETVNGKTGTPGLKANVTTLMANSSTAGSVDYKIAQALAWIEVV